jgi:TIR domain
LSEPRLNPALTRRIARILKKALERGASIEIDGLGMFLPGRNHRVRFVAQTRPRVFIAYVEEDLVFAQKLCHALEANGFRPWLDKRRLMPGQNWPRAIESAIQTSDFFVACFSRRAASKRGGFQSELRYALSCASRVPLDEIFVIPLRLDECIVPRRISRHVQYLDLFPDWDASLRRVIATMKAQERRRKRKRLPVAG